MAGDALAHRLLRLDAAYCAGAGAIAIVLSAPLARLFDAPNALVVVVGSAAMAWSLVLLRRSPPACSSSRSRRRSRRSRSGSSSRCGARSRGAASCDGEDARDRDRGG